MVLINPKKVALKQVVSFQLSSSYGQIIDHTIAIISLLVKHQDNSPGAMTDMTCEAAIIFVIVHDQSFMNCVMRKPAFCI